MPLTRFAMIVKGPGYQPQIHSSVLASVAFSTTVTCVSSLEQALTVARGLLQDGVQLIELCGGFSPDEAEQVHASIGGGVPVGVVRYSEVEQAHLSAMFGSPPAGGPTSSASAQAD